MRLRSVFVVAWITVSSGCDGTPGTASRATVTALAGSCLFAAEQRCDDYAEPQASPTTVATCASMGGAWASNQCPLSARAVVCLESPPATRSYAYSPGAASELAARCPAGKLIELDGACDMTAVGLCDEYMGTGATGGGAANRCRTGGGTWTAGGLCAMEGRSASCARSGMATNTYAYGATAADMLSAACKPDDFKRLGSPPPVMMLDGGP